MYSLTVPFQPPMEDLRLVVRCEQGATCYVFDTCCGSITPEEKRAADRRLLAICHNAATAARIRREEEKDKTPP